MSTREFSLVSPELALIDFWKQFPNTTAKSESGRLLSIVGEAYYKRLHPVERALVERAVDSRRFEFAATRKLAHEVLDELNQDVASIGKDSAGAPMWPPGLVGSLTHCTGFRAAVASTTLTSVGIDAEPVQRLPRGVMESIASVQERQQLIYGGPLPLDTVLFSAKESLYKTWYPVMGTWLGFRDAQIEITVRHVLSEGETICGVGSFKSVICEETLHRQETNQHYSSVPQEFTGQWLVHSGLILTACYLP